ncbi:hypothetical protein GEMRC1_012465 [Eukaryota sp. GEM-RC1]
MLSRPSTAQNPPVESQPKPEPSSQSSGPTDMVSDTSPKQETNTPPIPQQSAPPSIPPPPSTTSVPVSPLVTISDILSYIFPSISTSPTTTSICTTIAQLLSTCQTPTQRLDLISSLTNRLFSINTHSIDISFLKEAFGESAFPILLAPTYFGLPQCTSNEAWLSLTTSHPNIARIISSSGFGSLLVKQAIKHCIAQVQQSALTIDKILNICQLDASYFKLIFDIESGLEGLLGIPPVAMVYNCFKGFMEVVNDDVPMSVIANQFESIKIAITSANRFWMTLFSTSFVKSHLFDYLWNISRLLTPRQMLNPNVDLPPDDVLHAFYLSLAPLAGDLMANDGVRLQKVDPTFVNFDHRFPYSEQSKIKDSTSVINERAAYAESRKVIESAQKSTSSQSDSTSFNLNTEFFFLIQSLISSIIVPFHRDLPHIQHSLRQARTRMNEMGQGDPRRKMMEARIKSEENRINGMMKLLGCPVIIENCILSGSLGVYFVKHVIGVDVIQSNCEQVLADNHPWLQFPSSFLDPFFSVLASFGRLISRPGLSRLLTRIDLITSSFDTLIDIAPLCGRADLLPSPDIRGKMISSICGALKFKNLLSNRILTSKQLAISFFVSIIKIFNDFENTEAHAAFYEKFPIRNEISEIFKILHHNGDVPSVFSYISAHNIVPSSFFHQFITLLLNDVQYLIDDGLSKLSDITDSQDEEQRVTAENLKQHAVQLLRWGVGQLYLCALVASYLPSFFAESAVVSRASNTLVFLIASFTGKKCKSSALELLNSLGTQGEDPIEAIDLAFKAGMLMSTLSEIKNFDKKLAEDLFNVQCDTLPQFISLVSPGISESQQHSLQSLLQRVSTLSSFVKEREALAEKAPDKYLDSLSYTLMDDPVLLPNSEMVMDRAILVRHLLSDPRDPFTRAPLKIEECTELSDLRLEIEDWIQSTLESLNQ